MAVKNYLLALSTEGKVACIVAVAIVFGLALVAYMQLKKRTKTWIAIGSGIIVCVALGFGVITFMVPLVKASKPKVIGLVNYGDAGFDVVKDNSAGEEQNVTLKVSDDGYMPDVSMSKDALEEKYGWIYEKYGRWVDRSSYSVMDRERMASVKHSLGREFPDALALPLYTDVRWMMAQKGYVPDGKSDDKVTLNNSNQISEEDLIEKLDKDKEDFYNVKDEKGNLRNKTSAELERTVRETEYVRIHLNPLELDSAMLMFRDQKYIYKFNATWIDEYFNEWRNKFFIVDEDGNVTGTKSGFAGWMTYAEGHAGDKTYIELIEDYDKFAGFACNVIDCSEFIGERRKTTVVRYPLYWSANDDERRAYREDDPKKQESELSFVFSVDDKSKNSTTLYGINWYDGEFVIYKPQDRNKPSEPPKETPKEQKKTTTEKKVIQTSTPSSTNTGTPPGENPGTPDKPNPDKPDKPDKPKENGKDESFSPNGNPNNNQGVGANDDKGTGSVQDVGTVAAGDTDRATEDANKQQEADKQNSAENQQQVNQDAAEKDVSSENSGTNGDTVDYVESGDHTTNQDEQLSDSATQITVVEQPSGEDSGGEDSGGNESNVSSESSNSGVVDANGL